MRYDVGLVLDEPGHPASLRVHFPRMAFDFPGLVGGVHLDFQGAGIRFDAVVADSAFPVPLFRVHCTDVGTT